MGLLCRVEGWPVQPPIADADRLPLQQRAVQALSVLSWMGAPPVVTLTADGTRLRVAITLVDGDAQWREVAQLVAFAMVMSQSHPQWLWTVHDEGDVLLSNLKSANVVAWQGIFAEHPMPDSQWSVPQIRKDRSVNSRVWHALSQVVSREMKALGLAGQDSETETLPSPQLLRFDHHPASGWQDAAEAAQALAWVGRCTVRLDGRQSTNGQWRVSVQAEVYNPNTLPLAAVRIQVRLQDGGGGLVGVFEARAENIAPGAVRLVSGAEMMTLGTQTVHSVDIGCEALLSRTVSFPVSLRGG